MTAATLRSGLRFPWAVFATALAFACFGVGGVLLGIFAFPVMGLLERDPVRRQLRARRLVQLSFACFIELMRSLRILRYEMRGLERLNRPGLLILANHPSLIDVVFLGSLVRNADCVVRSGLADNIFTRGPVRGCGYIRNAGGAALLEACIASLQKGGNLIIFPEGTRTRPGQPLLMQRGAAQIATRAGINVTPVTIRCDSPGLSKGQPWWKAAIRTMGFSISVGEDITVAPFLERTAHEPALAARHLTAYLRDYFSQDRV